MSTLAHIFEAAGIATVVLVSTRDVAERMNIPRGLYGDFPMGRPLGRPTDADFQTDVLTRAFALLEVSEPTLVDHPTVVESAEDTVLSCQLPPRFDPDVPASVDEARGIRKAYDRTLERRGVTSVGRVLDADGIPDALAALHEIAEGADWTTVALPGKNTIAVCHDIRTYYEEAALELVDGPPPGGRAAESWYFDQTEAGSTVMGARQALRDAEAPFPFWFYMAPGHR
ncbi:MAG: hypothetical protein ACR2QE_00275 [Acidimicrobiales bacterium]